MGEAVGIEGWGAGEGYGDGGGFGDAFYMVVVSSCFG